MLTLVRIWSGNPPRTAGRIISEAILTLGNDPGKEKKK